jgi:hypothetical protein
MKASELRIGNHIQCLDEILTVEYLDKLLVKGNYHRDAVWNTSVQLKHCKPIPLTEEWLLKFGFESDGIEWWNGVLSLGIYKDGLYYCPTEDIHYRLGKEFKYVHQLQNLHHALTDEELTIK